MTFTKLPATLTEITVNEDGAVVILPESARAEYDKIGSGRKSGETLKFIALYEALANVETTARMIQSLGKRKGAEAPYIDLDDVNALIQDAVLSYAVAQYDNVLVANTAENRQALGKLFRTAFVTMVKLVKEDRKTKDNVTLSGRVYSTDIDGYRVTISVHAATRNEK